MRGQGLESGLSAFLDARLPNEQPDGRKTLISAPTFRLSELRMAESISAYTSNTINERSELSRLVRPLTTFGIIGRSECACQLYRRSAAQMNGYSVEPLGDPPPRSRITHSRCNFGRLCGSLTVGGRDVGQTLIGEGLVRPCVCSGTRCPPRQGWCG